MRFLFVFADEKQAAAKSKCTQLQIQTILSINENVLLFFVPHLDTPPSIELINCILELLITKRFWVVLDLQVSNGIRFDDKIDFDFVCSHVVGVVKQQTNCMQWTLNEHWQTTDKLHRKIDRCCSRLFLQVLELRLNFEGKTCLTQPAECLWGGCIAKIDDLDVTAQLCEARGSTENKYLLVV